MKDKKVVTIIITLAIIFTILGGTLAYWSWQSSNAEKTNVTFTVGSNFSCSANGGGNITNNAYFVPTDCTNSTYAIQREITTNITNSGEDDVYLQMWLNINSIGSGLSGTTNFKYALTTDSTSCTNNVINSGNFYGKQANDKVDLLEDVTEGDTYYLYIWLDSAETDPSTMNQSVSLSLDGECSNQEPNKVYMDLFARNIYDEYSDSYYDDNLLGSYRNYIKSVSLNNIDNMPYDAITFDLGDYNYGNVDDVVGWLENGNNGFYDLKIASSNGGKIYTKNLANTFWNMYNLTSVNLSGLNTSEVTNMCGTFGVGSSRDYLSALNYIDLGDKFYTSNVTNMASMFMSVYPNHLDLGSHFNTSNVTNFSSMFSGFSGNNYCLNLGDDFSAQRAINMASMFRSFGTASTNFCLNFGNNFNASNTVQAVVMFSNAGYNSTNFSINLGNNFNISGVANANNMFGNIGRSSNNFSLNLGNNFNISNEDTIKSSLFGNTGLGSHNLSVDLGNNFNLCFLGLGQALNSIVFINFGSAASDISLKLGNHFNANNLTNMSEMFSSFANYASSISFDMTGFNTDGVTNMNAMFKQFANLTTGYVIINLGNNFNTSNVTNMSSMFQWAGQNATNFSLNLGNNFDTSNVTDMANMFAFMGRNTTSFGLNLGNKFNTINVTNMAAMFSSMGLESSFFALNLGDKFDTSSAVDMRETFFKAGYVASSIDIYLGNKINLVNADVTNSMFGNFVKNTKTNFVIDLSSGLNMDLASSRRWGMFNNFPVDYATIYVSNSAAQDWIINKNSEWGTSFNATNVLIK